MHMIYPLKMIVTKMIDKFIYNFFGALDKAVGWIDNIFFNKKKKKKR